MGRTNQLAPTLQGAIVTLRPACAADLPVWESMFHAESLRRWWRAAPDAIDDDEVMLAIEVAGEVAGMIQFGEELDPDYHSASIDIFVGEPFQRRGAGTDAIRTLARYLIDVRGHHRITLDPAAANFSAIACYAKVGFTAVGVMREYERGADGTWHDGLLMELIAADLR